MEQMNLPGFSAEEMMKASALLLLLPRCFALDNGLALTPPMGFNSYMAGVSGESGLGDIASFLVSSGLRESGYVYVNTDEGWESSNRDADGRLQWDAGKYPSGLPNFTATLRGMGLKYGIYGASSGVTCGTKPGQLYHEDVDARTYVAWGVEFLKSDNCASYALDPSVRFGAMRDALNRTGARVLLSIEPFSIAPDAEQSSKLANMWRTGTDIAGNWGAVLDRADVADKWAPLAGPTRGWNDPDMINVQSPDAADGALTLAENRAYFGLWAIIKAPLLLSANLRELDARVIAVVNNTELIAVNQDALGVAARKLAVDGAPLGWLVGLESCAAAPPAARRGFAAPEVDDNRAWDVTPADGENGTHAIRSLALPGRCLAATGADGRAARADASADAVVLLPCNASALAQQWRFDKGLSTVTSITSALTGAALAVSNGTLLSAPHDGDALAVSDAAYGLSGLVAVAPYDQAECDGRDCQNYEPSQMWYWSPSEKLLRHAQCVSARAGRARTPRARSLFTSSDAGALSLFV